MHLKWERIFGRALTSFVAIMGATTVLCAAPYVKKENSCDERPPQFAFSYPKDLNLHNPMDWYIYVEGLAMQGRETGLSFTMVNRSSEDQTLRGTVGGFSGEDENWDYNFGTRIAIGGYIPYDAWNIDVAWTWLNIKNHENFKEDEHSTLPLWLPDTGAHSTVATSCGANWSCKLNVLDAKLGKPYHVSRKLIFNPHFGLRFAWINQDYGVDYGGTTAAYRTIFDTSHDFWGVGARLGIDSDWILCRGFKFFTKLSSSILAGSFDLSEKFSLLTARQSTVDVKFSDDFQMVVPNLEAALGVSWGFYSKCHDYYLDFRAGYEFQVWWDQWNMRQIITGTSDNNFNNVPTHGNLTLNGFTFKIQLDL